MDNPGPFYVAREIANNVGSTFRGRRDQDQLDQILSQSMKSNDPAKLQQDIGKILSRVSPERQSAAINLIQNKIQNLQTESQYSRGMQEKMRQEEIVKQEAMRKEELGRKAAQEAGYTYGVPGAVGAAQVKEKGKQGRLSQYGLGGVSPQENINQISENPFKRMTKDQLILATGSADREISEPAKAMLKQIEQEEANKPGREFATIREKAVADYVNHALTTREEAENLKYTIDEVETAIKGDVAGPGVTALAKNNPYTQILIGLSPDEATLNAANKRLLEGSKNIFGSKPTEREIFLLLNSMLPSIGKTKESNLASLSFIKRINEMKIMHADIVDELTEGGTKYVADLEKQVNAQMKPYAENLRKDLSEAVEALKLVEKDTKANTGKIRVKAPNGSMWEMTQEQIDNAKNQGVNFEPVK